MKLDWRSWQLGTLGCQVLTSKLRPGPPDMQGHKKKKKKLHTFCTIDLPTGHFILWLLASKLNQTCKSSGLKSMAIQISENEWWTIFFVCLIFWFGHASLHTVTQTVLFGSLCVSRMCNADYMEVQSRGAVHCGTLPGDPRAAITLSWNRNSCPCSASISESCVVVCC